MIRIDKLGGRKTGVFGLGKAGESSALALLASGAEVYAWDDSEKGRSKISSSAVKLQEPEEWPWKELEFLVLSPGIPLDFPKPHKVVEMARAAGKDIIGDIELLYMACPEAKYLGITGTNGKSTTTALTAHILREAGMDVQVGGNLGTPALDLEPLGEEGVYVLEVSSYQIDLLKTVKFNVATLINITPDHIDRHGSFEGYAATKKKIFARQLAGDFALVSVDDESCAKIAGELEKEGGREVIKVSVGKSVPGGISAREGEIDFNFGMKEKFDLAEAKALQGRHNWQNAAFAAGCTLLAGVPAGKVREGLISFGGLAHRMERVGEASGVLFVNDSKATNADAAANALDCYDNIFWIIGGKAKEGGISSLAKYFPKITKAYLIGEAAEEFARTLEGKVKFEKCGDLANATTAAANDAFSFGKQAVVLLSPACASFDQWDSFEHRGDAFREMAKAIIAKNNQVRQAS